MKAVQTQIVDLPSGSGLLFVARERKVSLICKYVVVKCTESERLIFGPVETFPYHANLVREFCELYEVAGGWEKKPDSYVIYDFGCSVAGGGWMEYLPQGDTIKLYGASSAYGRFDHTVARHLLGQDSRFSAFSYEIRD